MKKKITALFMAALTISSASVGYAQENTEQSYEGVTLQIAHSVTDSNADSFQAEFEHLKKNMDAPSK